MNGIYLLEKFPLIIQTDSNTDDLESLGSIGVLAETLACIEYTMMLPDNWRSFLRPLNDKELEWARSMEILVRE